MQNILRELYFGNISEWDRPSEKKKEDKEWEAYKKMSATFSKEQRELFDAFYSFLILAISEEKSEVYFRGFKTGASVALEIANFRI